MKTKLLILLICISCYSCDYVRQGNAITSIQTIGNNKCLYRTHELQFSDELYGDCNLYKVGDTLWLTNYPPSLSSSKH